MIRISSHLFKILSSPRSLHYPNANHLCDIWKIVTNSIPAAALCLTVRCSANINNIKRTNIAADRNSSPIAEALANQVEHERTRQFLEIASGTGQHLGFFAPRFPNINFQPTEIDPINFASIRGYAADCVTRNIREPINVDICVDFDEWEKSEYLQPTTYDYVYNCNMIHIAPWKCTVGLFRSSSILLKEGGLLFIYGPFALNGVLTPESNVQFNDSLRSRNPEWGVRDIADLQKLGRQYGMSLTKSINMPSNNKLLTWIKEKQKPVAAKGHRNK